MNTLPSQWGGSAETEAERGGRRHAFVESCQGLFEAIDGVI